MSIRVDSEIGELRRVLLHRPGAEIDRMVPSMMHQLLFDDILFGDKARAEHAAFAGILERAGAEPLFAGDLLAEVLEIPLARQDLVAELRERGALDQAAADRLLDLEPAALAEALVAGVRGTHERMDHEHLFELGPLPNYFFQRDPQVVIGDRVIFASMATGAREREPVVASALFRHHPRLAGYRAAFPLDHQFEPAFPRPTLEGGDVLVADERTLLVGISERTNRRGVENLAEYLRREPTSFRQLLAIELPKERWCMHLDTVLTFIDAGVCLAYLPALAAGAASSCRVYRVDLAADELSFTLRHSLDEALAEAGLELEMIPCGGARDLLDQEREQWTDGANAFALAPGVIVLYRRNRRTVDELAERGWRVVGEERALAGEPLLGRGPTVITVEGHELSRARGGPRCMTMPLLRASPAAGGSREAEEETT